MLKTATCLFTLALTAFCQAADETKPPAIATIHDSMRKVVDAQEVAGAVTLVATPDQVVHLDVVGKADIGEGTLMEPYAIFWIASMTKPILGTLLMMLQDEGKLSVDDPVEKYLPEFANLKNKDGKPARLLIRHLVTHTSGMSDITGEEARGSKTLAALIPLFVAKPVQFEPGSKWQYCQSSINTGGRIVEVLSGMSFDEFAQKRLFSPLGMKDTTFYLSEKQLPRLAKSYQRTNKGQLEAVQIRFLNGTAPTSRDRYPAANGGLFSTAPDYARFCQMILNNGEYQGKRYLRPETVKQMTTVQTGDLKTGFTPGNGWGLGWCVVREPQGITGMLSSGSFGHGGAYGTQAWIDPQKKRIYILMVQRSNFANSDASPVRQAFQESAAAALNGAK
jgi:CubicO group peptidase (beta-lactamase class C family)